MCEPTAAAIRIRISQRSSHELNGIQRLGAVVDLSDADDNRDFVLVHWLRRAMLAP